jgi:phosphoglycerate dehydrogenase-like enzyme
LPAAVFKVTDYIEPDLDWEREECLRLGLRFAAYQLKDAPSSALVASVGDADIVLVNMASFTAEVIAGLAAAKVIIRHGIGYDNVDVDAATGAGIIFANRRPVQPATLRTDEADRGHRQHLPSDLPLLEMDNALLTPHMAWYSEEGGEDIRRMIMEDVKRYLDGEPPRHVVNKEVLGRPNLRFRPARLTP